MRCARRSDATAARLRASVPTIWPQLRCARSCERTGVDACRDRRRLFWRGQPERRRQSQRRAHGRAARRVCRSRFPVRTVNRSLRFESAGASIRRRRRSPSVTATSSIAGGVESMTRAPYVLPKSEAPFGRKQQLFDTVLGWRMINPKMPAEWTISLGETAEKVAEQYGISREEQDRFAFESQMKCKAAIERGAFVEEIVALPFDARGNATNVAPTNIPRPQTTLDALAKLKPTFKSGGTVTAGNSSGINDGAAALLLCEAERAQSLGLAPLARVVACARVRRRARRDGTRTDSGDAESAGARGHRASPISISSKSTKPLPPSPSPACASSRSTRRQDESQRRGDCARSSARRERRAHRNDAAARASRAGAGRYGLATMCIGVGQGIATVFERVE